jgi:predicted DNA-binding protein (MmcQ/YjbR family)
MNPAELRDQCLSFPGSEGDFPFDPKTSVFRVAGKMLRSPNWGRTRFGSVSSASLNSPKCCAGAAAVLPGYHLNKRHWNTVIIDGSLPDDAIATSIEDSYDLVVISCREPVVALSLGPATQLTTGFPATDASVLWSTSPVPGSSPGRPGLPC